MEKSTAIKQLKGEIHELDKILDEKDQSIVHLTNELNSRVTEMGALEVNLQNTTQSLANTTAKFEQLMAEV